MANPNKLSPKIVTSVIIVSGQASTSGLFAPLFVSEFASSASFPTRIKSYSGTRSEMAALMIADGFTVDDPAYRQMWAAMSQGGPPETIWIGRADSGDLTWAETLDAIYAENSDDWYAMCVDVRDSADIQAISAWVEPPGDDPKFALYIAQTDSAQVLNAAPGNFADVIAALGRSRTALHYHDPVTASGYGPASITTRIGPFPFGASESLEFRFDGGATQSFAFTAAAAELTGSIAEPFDLSSGGTLTLAANGLAALDVELAAESATVQSVNAEPFVLSPGDTLLTRVDGAAAQTTTVDAGPAVTTGGVAEPFAITPAWQLDLDINGGGTQSFIFDGTETTAENVSDLINLTATGFTAADDGAGAVEFTTTKQGTGATIEVLASSTAGLLAALGLVAGTDTGTGDVADIEAVTAAELVTVVNADTTGLVASDNGGYLLLTADSVGTASRIQVTGGAVNDALAFSTDEQSGSGDFADATAATATEVVSAINSQVAGMVASVDTGAVVLTSDVLGTSSSITVTAGAVATTLGLAAGTVSGSGDFADASQATASEIAVVVSATIADGSVASPGSTVELTSASNGSDSSVEIITDSVGLTWSGDGYAVGTGTDEDYMDCALVGRCITFDLDAENGAALWDNQTLEGIEPDVLTDAQKTSLDQRRINAYYSNAGRPEFHWGYCLKDDTDDPLYIDEVTSADWLDARMTEAINALLNNHANAKTKIPYDDRGFALIENVFRGVLKRADRNGHIEYDGKPLDLTSETSTGVYVPRRRDQSQSDINARRYAGLRARQNFRGGVQRVSNLIEVQRPAVQL